MDTKRSAYHCLSIRTKDLAGNILTKVMFLQGLVVGLMCQSIQAEYWDYMRVFPGVYYTSVQHVRMAPENFFEAVYAPKQSIPTQNIYSALAGLESEREIKQAFERTIPYNLEVDPPYQSYLNADNFQGTHWDFDPYANMSEALTLQMSQDINKVIRPMLNDPKTYG
ncbi:hypothetical protein Pst134EA_013166 [Puccinia striiformis f. sp. tritici]|nr:hypothetical protein Pst134EA_013166 [Puccinia striiformis f. sp. tritici]KAH9465275.1 hypothetical protein Pst134EA_013166 [Puccinia striiformis f. sp. tritici]